MGSQRPKFALRRRARLAASASVVAVLSLWAVASPAQADVTSVSGSAFGESVNANPLNLGNVSSGPLPTVTLPSTGGGPLTNSVASACVPTPSCGTLQTGVLNVSTQGSTGPSGGSSSSASVANVTALNTPGLPKLTATAVSSQCSVGPNSESGSTTIVGGSFNGQSMAVNPPPNTTFTIDGVKLILNEQTTTGGAGNFGLTVNAVHLILSGIAGSGDIIIAQSHCDAQGPNVTIPFAPIGIIGASALVGGVLVRRQWRHGRGDGGGSVATSS